jgi:hypothetical protein
MDPLDGCHTGQGSIGVCTLTQTNAGILTYFLHPNRRTFHFQCLIAPFKFMAWEKDELRPMEFTSVQNIKQQGGLSTFAKYEIPAVYHWIICQLVAEDIQPQVNSSHEAARRQAYAQWVLDAFARKLKVIDDNSTSAMALFQSSVLTSIVQRQKAGLPNAYSPTVRTGIKQSPGPPTITEATIFYLGEDPTIPELIPYYRRNLLYIPEAHWHLGVVIGSVSLPDPDNAVAYYSRVMEDHDLSELKYSAYCWFSRGSVGGVKLRLVRGRWKSFMKSSSKLTNGSR